MKSAYWASTHPAWTPNGYKCLCGEIFPSMKALYHHVQYLSHHTHKEASQILSAKQWEHYCKSRQLTPKEIEKALF